MKSNSQRLISLILISMMIAFGMPGNVYGLTSEETSDANDPYEMMVDTQPDLLTVGEIIQSIAPEATSQGAIDLDARELSPSDYENITEVKQIVGDTVGELNENGNEVRLDSDLLDDVINQQRDLVEQSKTDRFIVKYKENGEEAFKEMAGDTISESLEIGTIVADNIDRNLLLSSKDVDGSYGVAPDTIDAVKWENDNTELLILDDRMNPSEYADTLRDLGVSHEIEYIQPDFQMDLNSVDDGSDNALSEASGDESLSLTVNEEPATNDNAEDETATTGNAIQDDDEAYDIVTPEINVTDEAITTEETETAPAIDEEILEEIGENSVLVAVLDTGVDITHPDLNDHIYVNNGEIPNNNIDDDGNGYVDDLSGWNFPENVNVVYDSTLGLEQAHGTHIAGIVAGVSNADPYLVPSENVKILPLKVFQNGTAYTSDIISAIEYAEKMGAKIVNCSFGSTNGNPALKEAIEKSGMLFICSVGNARTNLEIKPIYPACFNLENIISVASSNTDGGLSYFSNYSSKFVDVAALGRDIVSTLPDCEFGKLTGTSMSTALVSGIAATVLNASNNFSAEELKAQLIKTSDKLSNLQEYVADGRQINLLNAMNNIGQTDIIQNSPESDFNVSTYEPTQAELYQLYGVGSAKQVSAGKTFTVVLKNDGTVWAWGDNNYGQCGTGSISYSETMARVIGLTNVVSIDAGYNYSLALKSDGTVWAWGYNYYGQVGDGTYNNNRPTPTQVIGLTNIVGIAAGYNHALALKSDGTVWAWGYNSYGQVGDGTKTTSIRPVQVIGLTGIKAIGAGAGHSLALKLDGTVWAWGHNFDNQMGDGTFTNRTTPAQVSGLTDVSSIAVGGGHNLAIKTDGTVWAWGNNACGQVGKNYKSFSSGIIQVGGLDNVSTVAAGDSHSLAVKTDGTVWAWGYNYYGQVGDGTTTDRIIPVLVNGSLDVSSIDAGPLNSLVVKNDGLVWAWGSNNYGLLGNGVVGRRLSPVQVNGLNNVVGVTAGRNHSLALKSDGTAWAWGYNYYGQLGNGICQDSSTPMQVDGLTSITAISAGFDYSLALKCDGTAWAWGINNYGELGDGTTNDKMTPTLVSGLTSVSAIVAGYGHSIALKSDRTVWAWGYNNYGQIGNGTSANKYRPVQVSGLTGITAIAAGAQHSLALKSDGTVWAWGYNAAGELGDGSTTTRKLPVQVSGLTDIVAIDAGFRHNLALKSDGTVWAWGYNAEGELGDGTTTNRKLPVQVSGLTGIVGVFSGAYNSFALKSDGTMWAWGYNNSGQIGDGSTTNRTTPVQVNGLIDAVSVAAGESHSVAMKMDGTVVAFGSDLAGQLGQASILLYKTPIECQSFGFFSFENSSYIANIPIATSNTITVRAIWTDSKRITSTSSGISYSLNAYPGVSINNSTGVITIDSTTHYGTAQIVAEYQGYICNATLILNKVGVVFQSNSYTAVVSSTAEKFITVSAVVVNSCGSITSGASIYYNSADTYPGVSIISTTGAVIITPSAEPGQLHLIATYQNLTASAILNIITSSSTDNVINCTLGDDIFIPYHVNGATDMNNIIYSLNYRAEDLSVIDLVSQTKTLETASGVVTGSSIEILTVTPGVISFKVHKRIPDGKTWSGIVNIFRFEANISGQTNITVKYY